MKIFLLVGRVCQGEGTLNNKEERQEGKDKDSGPEVKDSLIEVRKKGGRKVLRGQAEQTPGQLKCSSNRMGGVWNGVFGRRQVRFPCPAGPWGVVVADVTSGARPPSLHLHNFPSLWSGVHLFMSWLVCQGRGGGSNPSHLSPYYIKTNMALS